MVHEELTLALVLLHFFVIDSSHTTFIHALMQLESFPPSFILLFEPRLGHRPSWIPRQIFPHSKKK